ncbi:MAG: hypothetical protein AAGU27_26020 [Dehalobacterium sp.]
MNEELRENIISEICGMVKKNPELLKMFEQMDKLYKEVEILKRELAQIQHDAKPNHLNILQDFAETMLFSLSEIESKRVLERKVHEQTEIIKHKDSQIKEAEAAFQQAAATRSKEIDGVQGEMERRDELLKEIKDGLAGFCSLPKNQRWQLILNEASIISHLKGVEQKINAVLGTK